MCCSYGYVYFVSLLCRRNTATVISASAVSTAVCSVGGQPAGLQMSLLIRGSGCPQPRYAQAPPCEPAQAPCPLPSPINFERGIMGSFDRPFSPCKGAVGL
ncbi:hypothetical protein L3Q82_010829 [Scortum barcoo]|uniref:Uncharacterized protein n=1 Tax=Scortum barcoo TaxID=214431 RepID=A0ACB8W9W2_9TELE|nr:hypothetical protein L3Q82_010829 [Scortum barcoo]